MEGNRVFGEQLSGAETDWKAYLQKRPVIVRFIALLSAIIVFGCISSQGWYYEPATHQSVCRYNSDAGACRYATGIAVIACLAALLFLFGEYKFVQFSSVKLRKLYVRSDLGFSALWTFLYFVAFCYLANAWSKSETTFTTPTSNLQAAIFFCFASIVCWGISTYLSYDRYKSGVGDVFEGENIYGNGFPPYPQGSLAQAGYQDQMGYPQNMPRGINNGISTNY